MLPAQPRQQPEMLPQVEGVGDEALDSLGAATQLTCLRMSGPRQQPLQVTDAGIAALAYCTQLRTLELLCMPDVTAAGWQRLSSLTRLTQLGLDWQGAASVDLLCHLQLLPLDKVCFLYNTEPIPATLSSPV